MSAPANTILPEKRLFWFLRPGTRLDLSDPATVDLYVQQVLTHGRADDVRALLRHVDRSQLTQALQRLARFLPAQVRQFWEDALGSA